MLKCIFSFFLIVDAFAYDIFDRAKREQCESVKNPVFTHEVTDFSKIEEIWGWGLTPGNYLKNHTYIFLKDSKHIGRRAIAHKAAPVYAPADSYLILYSKFRQEGSKDIHWRLMFQVGCEVVYRFDHLETLSKRIMAHLGEKKVDENQVKAPNIAVNPPLKIKAGELIAFTKSTWDFGVVDSRRNNILPKHLKRFEKRPTGQQFKYAACPYDYYNEKMKKKYLKKVKKGFCLPGGK